MPRSPSQAHQTPQSSHLNSHFDIPASSDQLSIIALSHTNIIVRNWAIQGLRCSRSIATCLRTHNTSSSTPPPTISSSFSVTLATSQPSGVALPNCRSSNRAAAASTHPATAGRYCSANANRLSTALAPASHSTTVSVFGSAPRSSPIFGISSAQSGAADRSSRMPWASSLSVAVMVDARST